MLRRCKLVRCGARNDGAGIHRNDVSERDHRRCEEDDAMTRPCKLARCGARSRDCKLRGREGWTFLGTIVASYVIAGYCLLLWPVGDEE
ncbi:hypothetical protein SESBI_40323 [Sesbania bispinosa]|nr:hypothetical protein SESBI_40323 [Sesbania bispinosa]